MTGAAEPALAVVRARAAEVGAAAHRWSGGDVPFSGRCGGDERCRGRDAVRRPPDRRARAAARRVSGRQHRHGGGRLRRAAARPGFAIDARGRPARLCETCAGAGRMDWIDGQATDPHRRRAQPGGHGGDGGVGPRPDRRPPLRRGLRGDAQQGCRVDGGRSAPSSPREIVVTAPAVERATPPEDLAGLFDPPPAIAADVDSALDVARGAAGPTAWSWSAARSTSRARRSTLLGRLSVRRRGRRGAWPRATASAGSRRCAPRPCRPGRSSAWGCS